MRYHADAYFMKGHSHDICQDYACYATDRTHKHGVVTDGRMGVPLAAAALSDGCSLVYDRNGELIQNPGTEIGAAVMARESLNNVCDDKGVVNPDKNFGVYSVSRLFGPCATMATLGTVHVAPSDPEMIVASLHGDGAIMILENGQWRGYAYSFPTTPRYPMSLSRTDTAQIRHIHDWQGDVFTWVEEYPATVTVRGAGSAIVMFSDGLFSFRDKTKSVDVVKEFMDFRGLRGRWCNRHLKGVCAELLKKGIFHDDDISMAGIYIE